MIPRLATIATYILVLGSVFSQTLTPQNRAIMVERISATLAEKAYDPAGKLKEWPKILERYKERLEAAESDDSFVNTLAQALAETRLSHLQILRPQVMRFLVTQQLSGIGAVGTPVGEEIVVTRVAPSSPAEAAGLRVGDTIISIDEEKPSNRKLFAEQGYVGLRFRTPEGTVHRRRIPARRFDWAAADEFRPLSSKTAYIRIHSFMDGAYSRPWVRQTMKEAVRYQNIILDLRGNGGGTLGFLADLCSYFLPPGTSLGCFISKKGVEMKEGVPYTPGARGPTAIQDLAAIESAGKLELLTPKPPYGPFRGKLVLLIDGGTGSAAEVTAGALVELGRPLAVIGEPSAGAVLASKAEPIGKGHMLQYPAADYLTPYGVRLEANPVQPTHRVSNIELALALQAGKKDPAIELALELLECR